jgi:hypothetical protein
MADEVKAETDEVVDLTDDAQVAALEEENAALRAQIDTKQGGNPMWRRVLAGITAVLAMIAVVAAVETLWLKTTLENEDQFVATFAPLPSDEAVAEALSIRVATEVVVAQDVEGFVAETLPDELGLLTVPITEGITRVIATVAKELIQSDQFTTVWTASLRGSHILVSAVLSGNDRALEAEDGAVAINLDAIAAEVVNRVEATGLELPEANVELGSVVIYQSDELAAAQSAAQFMSAIGWFLPLLALVLLAGAVWAASDRRRMVAILAFGSAIALLLSLAALRVGQNAILGDIESQINRDAARAVWDTTLARLTAGTWALIVLMLIVGFIAWVSGPSPRAQMMRSRGAGAIERWRQPTGEEPSGSIAFLAEWKRSIQSVIVAVGLLFVLFGPNPSGWLVLVTAAVTLALVVLVEVFAGPGVTAEREDAQA